MYLNKTEICKFATKDQISWYNFCLGSEWKDFNKDEQSKTSLNGIACDFLVGHISIKNEHILNIHQYLKIKKNIEWYKTMLALLKTYYEIIK